MTRPDRKSATEAPSVLDWMDDVEALTGPKLDRLPLMLAPSSTATSTSSTSPVKLGHWIRVQALLAFESPEYCDNVGY